MLEIIARLGRVLNGAGEWIAILCCGGAAYAQFWGGAEPFNVAVICAVGIGSFILGRVARYILAGE